MTLSVMGEDMGSQTKHWMVTLQEVFYPALAAVGIPCKYISKDSAANWFHMKIFHYFRQFRNFPAE